MNADAYVFTATGMLSANMYAYCENNPVNAKDSAGTRQEEAAGGGGGIAVIGGGLIYGFYLAVKQLVTDIAAAVNRYGGNPVTSSSQSSAGAAVGIPVSGTAAYASYQASQSAQKAQEKESTTPVLPNKQQAFFPVNPYDFHPNGLVMTEYPGTKNGRIIKWRDPISHAKIFEWDEDPRNGAHYHAMLIEWDGKHHGQHYLPGTPVPEPWNSVYFGG